MLGGMRQLLAKVQFVHKWVLAKHLTRQGLCVEGSCGRGAETNWKGALEMSEGIRWECSMASSGSGLASFAPLMGTQVCEQAQKHCHGWRRQEQEPPHSSDGNRGAARVAAGPCLSLRRTVFAMRCS